MHIANEGLFVILIVGVIAKYTYHIVFHEAVVLGWIGSIVLGIVGSYVAGLIGKALHPSSAEQALHPAGMLYSILGALLLLYGAHVAAPHVPYLQHFLHT